MRAYLVVWLDVELDLLACQGAHSVVRSLVSQTSIASKSDLSLPSETCCLRSRCWLIPTIYGGIALGSVDKESSGKTQLSLLDLHLEGYLRSGSGMENVLWWGSLWERNNECRLVVFWS